MPYRSTFTHVFSIDSAVAAAVFLVVLLVMCAALWIFRAGRHREDKSPSHRDGRTAIEASYVVLLVCGAIALTWLSLSSNGNERAADTAKPTIVVDVTAFQWCWQFSYQHKDVTVRGSCTGGRDLPTLILPANERVELDLTSHDVIHEFWVPYLRYKVEAFPHHATSLVVTLTRQGRWEGRCSEFCGLYHDDMEFWLEVVSPASYDRWLIANHGSTVL